MLAGQLGSTLKLFGARLRKRRLRYLEVPAMQARTKTWFRSLAAESWGCNPWLCSLPWLGEPDSKSRYA